MNEQASEQINGVRETCQLNATQKPVLFPSAELNDVQTQMQLMVCQDIGR